MVSPASKYCQSEARRLSAIVRERSGAGHVGLNGFPPWAMLAYHVSAMNSKQDSSEDIQGAAESALHDAASRLKELLSELARSLRPFPAFLNMSSVQAVELEPSFTPAADHGCVVVLPEGEICEMDLSVMPGIQGVMDIDQVERFKELELSDEEYIVYAATAIRLLCQELRRRGG